MRDERISYPSGIAAPLTSDFHHSGYLLERMDRTGIDLSILSLSPTLFFYDQTESNAIWFAELANNAMAEMVAESDRLAALAHLPMQSPGAAAIELERCVTDLGMCGALVGTNVGLVPLDDPRFDVLLATAQRLDVPLSLHPYFDGPKLRLEQYYFTNSIGNPLETCIAAARLIHAGTLDRFPALKLVLAHGGGYLPYQLGRLDHAWSVRPEPQRCISQPPSSYLRRFWFDSLTHGDEALTFLSEVVGIERLLLGTDLPFDMADQAPVDRIRRTGLDPARLGLTASELFCKRTGTTAASIAAAISQ